MNINKQDAKFHADLIRLINESNLPAAVVRYQLRETLAEVDRAYTADINKDEQEGESDAIPCGKSETDRS